MYTQFFTPDDYCHFYGCIYSVWQSHHHYQQQQQSMAQSVDFLFASFIVSLQGNKQHAERQAVIGE